jgi:hypothetical protein
MSFVVFQIFVNLRKIQVSVVTAVTGVDFGYWHLCCSKLPAAEGALLLQEPCCCRSPAVAGGLAIANLLSLASFLSEQSFLHDVAGFSMLRMSCSAIKTRIITDLTKEKLPTVTRISV